MRFMVSAGDIVAQGEAAGAERVCFYDGEYHFVDVNKHAISEALPRYATERYKLQAVIEGKWTNVAAYASVFDSTRLLKALEKADFSAQPDFDIQEISLAWRVNPDKAATALRKIFYNSLDQQVKRPMASRIEDVVSFFSQLEQHLKEDPHYEFFMGYLMAFREAQAQGLAALLASPSAPGVAQMIASLTAFMERSGRYTGAAEAGGSCVIGQILSLTDREAASWRFRTLRSSEYAKLVEFFYWDLGALTYFGADELGDSSAGVEAIIGSISPVHTPPTANTIAVGVSMDEAFFRIYAPWLYFYAQQLPHVDFNFILCTDSNKAAELMAEGAAFARALASMNMSGEPENVHLYSVQVPDFVLDHKTFFACARFFALPELLSRYPQVYLMDADLYPEDNPDDFFRRLRSVPFAVPFVAGPAGLSPWRRYMAGNVAANRSVMESGLLDDLYAYIVHGLHQRASWMLDQNALAFAVERSAPGTFVSLGSLKRPFTAPKFMSTWESNYRKHQAAHRA